MHTPRSKRKGYAYVGAAGIVLIFASAMLSTLPATADHLPADKVAVVASDVEFATAPLEEGASVTFVALLNATMRTSHEVDLVLQLTYECAIWTQVGVSGSGDSQAAVQILSVVTIDGVPVPITPETDTIDVTFCNRVYALEVLDPGDPEQQIEQYLATKSANAFNWVAVDVPAGVHDIMVVGILVSYVDGVGYAQAGIGSRTLVVEPVRLSSHA